MKKCRICGAEAERTICKICDSKRQREARRVRSVMVNEYKKGKACSICGGLFPAYVMDFHHVNEDKIGSIGDMVSHNAPFTRIIAEIKKCVLVCANCHRILHYSKGDINGNEID